MVHSVINTLSEFSETHDLLQTTIKYGTICLQNWMKESPDEHNQLSPATTVANFIFDRVDQQLIFFQSDKKTFILRTRYSLFTDKQSDRNKPVGWYALDVNQNGDVVDDWLHFD